MSDKKNVLVVDDEQEIRELFKAYLAKKGHRVSAVENGLEAIKKTDEEKFDFVFLDIKMSGLNGVETFKYIKNKNPETNVIIMTGYQAMAKELITDSVKKHVYSVLYKPFRMQKVADLMETKK